MASPVGLALMCQSIITVKMTVDYNSGGIFGFYPEYRVKGRKEQNDFLRYIPPRAFSVVPRNSNANIMV